MKRSDPEYMKAYWQNNKEKLRAQNQARYRKDKVAIDAQNMRSYWANRAQRIAASHRRYHSTKILKPKVVSAVLAQSREQKIYRPEGFHREQQRLRFQRLCSTLDPLYVRNQIIKDMKRTYGVEIDPTKELVAAKAAHLKLKRLIQQK